MRKKKLLSLIISILSLSVLCFYGGCGDDGASTFTTATGPTGPTGTTGVTGATDLYSLRIDVTHGGQPVSGFTVTLNRLGASVEGNLEGTDSSGQGWYQFDNLSPGNYLGSVSAENFETKVFNVTVPALNNQVGVTVGQWVIQDSGLTSGRLYGVSFADPNNGWAVGTDSSSSPHIPLITHTSNGVDWASQTPPPAPGMYFPLNAVDFPDTLNGWAVGQTSTEASGYGTSSPAIIHTTDGTNWVFQTVPDVTNPADPNTGEVLNGVDFVSSTTGWAVGGYMDPITYNQHPIILNTTNGTTWNIQTPADPNDNYSLNDVDFVDSLTGWAAGSNKVIHTEDGGNTWITQYTTSSSFSAVHFIDTTRGWVIGPEGMFYTDDGGNTWNIMADVNSLNLAWYDWDIFFTDASTGWAVGQGIIHKSAGADWIIQGNIPGGGFSKLLCMEFINSQRGWAVGHAGYNPSQPVILHYSE